MERVSQRVVLPIQLTPVRSITGLDAGLVLKSKTLGAFFNF